MNTRRYANYGLTGIGMMVMAAWSLTACAQTPVDDDGNVIGAHEPSLAHIEQVVGNEDIPLMSNTDIEDLVGPIALYPDDLLAIVLPASAYPLQIVDAARFLEEVKADPSLKPDPEWDDSVVALLNYPEILEHLNEDIDWTWRLGEAVVSQQGDVVAAIERFRDRAYAAGNLKSDSYQNVSRDNGVIEITPVADDVIYVPYYEPERVVVYQPRPVYYYYPRSYPVYYYPYPASYYFDRGYFWGVTTAFTIGWYSDSLNVYHHSYHGHPYYGRTYRDRWWYRRPTMTVYNTTYVRNTNVTINRYNNGDRWQPRHDRHDYVRNARVTRNWHQPPERDVQRTVARTERRPEPITFRDRGNRSTNRQVPAVKNQREPVRHIRPERREPVTTQRQERNEPATRQRQERPVPTARPRQEQQDLTARLRSQKQQPVRHVRQERREPTQQVRQARPQPSRQVTQERRTPTRQVRTERREPTRQVQQERPTRSTPPTRSRSESKPAPKKAETRRSEPRARPERRSRN